MSILSMLLSLSSNNSQIISSASVVEGGVLPLPTNMLNILMAGQSNLISRNNYTDTLAEAPHLPYTGQIKNAKYWNVANGQFENFTTSHNQYLADVNGDYGMGYAMGQKLLNARFCGAINLTKYGEGGTAIGLNGGYGKWSPYGAGGDRYNGLKTIVTGKTYDWFIWYQGETDTLNTTDASEYGTNLQAFMDGLKTVATFTNILIVRLGDIPDFINSGTAGVRAGQDLFITNNTEAQIYMPDVTGYTFADTSHYGLDKQAEIGEDIADLIIAT